MFNVQTLLRLHEVTLADFLSDPRGERRAVVVSLGLKSGHKVPVFLPVPEQITADMLSQVMDELHLSASTWPPARPVNWTCVQANVCVCVCAGAPSHRRYKDRWLGYPPLPCQSSAHAGVLRRSLRVCSVGSVFLSACAPRSAATGIGAAAPDGIRARSASRLRWKHERSRFVLSMALF